MSPSASPPPPCGMQLPVGAEVVVCWVVVAGGGGGGAACVVVAGGGAACVVVAGDGATCVVVAGGGVLLGAVGTAVAAALCAAALGAAALCADGLACLCRLALCAGLGWALVVLVTGVDWVVEVLLVAAAFWLEVDEDAPHALTINTSTTAAKAIRRCLMDVSPWPPGSVVRLTWEDAGRRGLLPGKLRAGRSARRLRPRPTPPEKFGSGRCAGL